MRERAGLSIRQVATKSGVPHSTVGGWFAGRGLPSVALRGPLIELLRACGVDDAELDDWMSAWQRARRVPGRRPSAVVPYRGLARFEPEDVDWFFGREALTTQLLEALDRLGRSGILLLVGASGAGKSSVLRAGLVPAVRAELSRPVVLMIPGEESLAMLTRKLDAAGERPVVIVDQFEEIFTAWHDVAERDAFIAALVSAADGDPGALVVLSLRADFYPQVLGVPRLRAAAGENQVTAGPMTVAELTEAIVGPARLANLDIEEGFVDAVLHDVAPHGSNLAGTLPLLAHALFLTWQRGRGRRLKIADYRSTGGIRGAVAESADAVYGDFTARERRLARRLFLDLVHVDPGGADTRRRVSRRELFAALNPGQREELADVIDRFVAQRLITVDVDTVEISHEALLSAWPQLACWLDTGRADLLTGRQLAQLAREWHSEGRGADGLLRGARLSSAADWARHHPEESTADVTAFLKASTRHERRRISRLRQTIAGLAVLFLLAAAGGATAVVEWNSAVAARAAADQERDVALSRLVATRSDQLRSKDASLSAQLAITAYEIAPSTEARSSLTAATGVTLADRLIDPDGNGLLAGGALDQDGHLVAVVRDDKLRIWDISSGRAPAVIATVRSPSGAPFSTVSFDHGDLLTGTENGAVQEWTIGDPRHPYLLATARGGSAGAVFGIAVTRDGHLLATSGGNGVVQLWSTVPALAAQGAPLRLTAGVIKSVALSADASTIALGTDSGAVTLWDISDRTRPLMLGTAGGLTKEIGQIALSPDGRLLAAGGRNNRVNVWNVADPRHPAVVARLGGAQSWINALAFSPEGSLLAAGSSDATVGVRMWDTSSFRLVAVLPHPSPVTSVTFAADGRRLLSTANDGITRLWPVHGPELAASGVVSAAVFSPNGRTLAVGSTTAGMQLWNTANPREPVPYGPPLMGPDGFAGSVAFTPDGGTLAVSYGKGSGMRVWNVSDPAHPAPDGPALDTGGQMIESVAFSPDGRTLAAAGDDETVQLWNVRDPAAPVRRATLGGFTSYVTWVAFSPDGRTLAASSDDKTIRLWDVSRPSTPRALGKPLLAGDHYVYSVAFSPDGRTLAAGNGDSTIRLWDVSQPSAPRALGKPLTGPTDYVYLLCFAPNGRTLAAATTDGGVWLWNVRDREHPVALAAVGMSPDALYTVGYRRDSTTLVAGGAAGTARIMISDPAAAMAAVCGAIGDRVTRAEWSLYVPGRAYAPPC